MFLSVQPQALPEVPAAVMLLIPLLVGRLGIPLINWIKNYFNFQGPNAKTKNTWLSFGVSTALAIFALAITSSFVPLAGPETMITWIGVVFSTATLIYKSVKQPETPTP